MNLVSQLAGVAPDEQWPLALPGATPPFSHNIPPGSKLSRILNLHWKSELKN
jgi:hypothetical protein